MRGSPTPKQNKNGRQNNYYPFGLKHKGYNELPDYSVTNKYRYAFGGKEFNSELGLNLYDFGARNYDAAIGRWLNMDPLAEVQPDKTLYHYVGNNPIKRIDPTGMLDHDYKINRDGSFTKLQETTTPDRVFNSEGGFVELESNGQIETMKQHGGTSVLKFEDTSKSTEAFEFFAQNSDVEWGEVKTDQSSYVLTDNSEIGVSASAYAYSFLLNQGKNVTDINHSHPVHLGGIGESPSGYGHNPTKNNMYSEPSPYGQPYGDYGTLRTLIYGDGQNLKGFGDKAKNINFRVYNPVTNTYIKYDETKAIKIQ